MLYVIFSQTNGWTADAGLTFRLAATFLFYFVEIEEERDMRKKNEVGSEEGDSLLLGSSSSLRSSLQAI
jgi:hypothetical protein